MTQAPTPGPLSGDDVKLLVKGDLLRYDGHVVEFDNSDTGEALVLFKNGPALRVSPSACSFIGRPDADGWMPWSGGENPVPGQMVEVRLHNGRPPFTEPSNGLSWSRDANEVWSGHQITAFRLAPTAPVEASGSERDQVTAWAKALYSTNTFYEINDDWHDMAPNDGGIHDLHIDMARAAKRVWDHADSPQPSGETRGLMERATAIADDVERGKRPKLEAVDMIRELRSTLLSALSTTPARAEAQDEGAAGEPDLNASLSRMQFLLASVEEGVPAICDSPLFASYEFAADFKRIVDFAAAHPSSTPAADEDRVREAIADVISHENDWRTALTAMDAAEETPEDGSGKPGYWLHQIKVLDRIVAALKSEGK